MSSIKIQICVFIDDERKKRKDFGGIKAAAQIDIKSDGFNRKLEVIEFKVLKPVDPSLFSSR